MKGKKETIRHLNLVLGNELTAINQYFLHSRMLNDWGYTVLGTKLYEESIDEMKHADELIQRLLFLEGKPDMQQLGTLHIGSTVPGMLKNDLEMEYLATPCLRTAIAAAESEEDFVSRMLFEHILDDEEKHIDWLEIQLKLLEQLGLQNYLQSVAP